ncbi:MAG: hypothetical protein FJX52_15380, partial [Alphaproteobacteria bacterium]|nr:hypothetical protein [Alphaproteobacteria bacterium]
MVASYSEQIKAIRHQRRQAVLAHWLTFRSVMSRSAYAEMMGVPPRAVPRIDAPDWDVDEATWPVLEERLPGDWLAVQRPPAFADASFDEAARDRTGRIVQAVEFWKASRQFFDNRFADAV